MFKRGKPLTLGETAKQIFWPSMGWRRMITYTKHRLLRISDTTRNIALGLAIGLGVSFTPLLGTHFIQAAALAYVMRANIVTAMIGTWVGNPYTFPFFWWAGFSFGSFLYSFFGLEGAESIPEVITFSVIYQDFWSLFMPWMLGGYTLFILSVPPAYFMYFKMVERAKKVREKSAQAKRKSSHVGLKVPK